MLSVTANSSLMLTRTERSAQEVIISFSLFIFLRPFSATFCIMDASCFLLKDLSIKTVFQRTVRLHLMYMFALLQE
jgi:hypothetical protein